MKKVYILYKTQREGFEIVGAYENREKAEKNKQLKISKDEILILTIKGINDKYDQKIKELEYIEYSSDEFYWSNASKIEAERHDELIKVNADWVEYEFSWNYYIKEFVLK